MYVPTSSDNSSCEVNKNDLAQFPVFRSEGTPFSLLNEDHCIRNFSFLLPDSEDFDEHSLNIFKAGLSMSNVLCGGACLAVFIDSAMCMSKLADDGESKSSIYYELKIKAVSK